MKRDRISWKFTLIIIMFFAALGVWFSTAVAKAETMSGDVVLVTMYADEGTFEDKKAYHVNEVIKGRELAVAFNAPGVIMDFPKRAHHELVGWKVTYESSKKTVEADYELVKIYANENISLHPIWKEYAASKVILDANGGTFSNGKSTYTSTYYEDKRILLAPNEFPQKKGQVIMGWSSKNNLNYGDTTTFNGKSIISNLAFDPAWSIGVSPKGDDTLIAQWAKGNYVTIDFNGGTNPNYGPVYMPEYSLPIPAGESVRQNDISFSQLRDSYNGDATFLGWKLVGSSGSKLYTSNEVLSYVPTKNVTFVAQFKYQSDNGWITTGKGRLYLEDGVPVTGWFYDNLKWNYADKNGIVQTGWVKISGKWYYFNNGMCTGWNRIKYNWYLFDNNGVMQTGWKKSGGSWYYLDPKTGMMQTGKTTIDGVLYNFAPSGELYENGDEYSNTGIVINATNFPDPALLKYITNNSFDTDRNEILSWKELQAVKRMTIDCSVWGDLKSLKGIEKFKSLNYLKLSGVKAETLSVSGLDALESLIVNSGSVKNLLITNCQKLKTLDCTHNKLTSLDVSKLKTLKVLYCEYNSFNTISITQNPYLCSAYNNKDGANNEGSSTIYISSKGDCHFSVDNSVKVESRVFSREWFDGKWYNADGSQTYGATLSWKHDSKGWWVTDTTGWYAKNQWEKIDGVMYYFKGNGYMATNEWVKGYYFNKDGSWTYTYKATWRKSDKGWWYGDKSGWYAKNQTITIDGKKYTFDAKGYLKE